MLCECTGSAKHHKFKFAQHGDMEIVFSGIVY